MTKTKKNTYHHGDLRATLIQAAIKLLPVKGASGLSLREVAKAAGVSHAAPYRHFNDKAALLTALAQTGFEQLAQAMATVVEQYENDPQQQLVAAAVAYVELGLRNPDMMHLMFGGVLDPELLSEEFCATSEKAFSGLLQIISAGQEAGVFKSSDVQILAISAWSMTHGLMMLITAGQLREVTTTPEQVKQLSRQLAQNLLNGILV
jgi:AcrR family transcriptional regulator